MDVTANWEDKMMSNRKKAAALICGMFGCVFLGSGDWLMWSRGYKGEGSFQTLGNYSCSSQR